jgi:DNA processing protein
MLGRIQIGDSFYPKLLKMIQHPPNTLYYKGNFEPHVFDFPLAVVGSRKMTPYGKKAVEKIVGELDKKITVVSGFMYGVDMEAHLQAMRNGLKTVAVLPCGIDYYSNEQKEQIEQIVSSGGVVLSEYEGAFAPRNWTYPRRNRVVAGLCKALVVIEATLNSGSLITSNFALGFNRKVYAVPGSIFNVVSSGCLKILKEYASVLVDGYEVNKFFGLVGLGVTGTMSSSVGVDFDNEDGSRRNSSKVKTVRNSLEEEILKVIKSSPATIDDILTVVKGDIGELSTRLTLLELAGFVSEENGRFYAS